MGDATDRSDNGGSQDKGNHAHLLQTGLPGTAKVIRQFKGGSVAATLLVEADGKLFVRKTCQASQSSKLRNQYRWLKKNEPIGRFIPKVLREGEHDGTYYYDLHFYDSMTPLFTLINFSRIEDSSGIITGVIDACFTGLYLPSRFTPDNKEQTIRQYIDEKLLKKVEEVAKQNEDIRQLLAHEEIIINHERYRNFHQILQLITADERIMRSLVDIPWAENIHGDITVDNIICNRDGEFVILDPNDENYVSSPLIDLAKLYQSLHSGYEFLIEVNKSHRFDNQLIFNDHSSRSYKELFELMKRQMAKYLSPEDINKILFFEATHYARMLPYKQKINPDTTAMYYAVMVRLLNEFYDQAKRHTP